MPWSGSPRHGGDHYARIDNSIKCQSSDDHIMAVTIMHTCADLETSWSLGKHAYDVIF
jgi:hypothetical protein